MTGQDVERGTFSQRHLVLHDAKTGQTVCPIQSLPGALAPFELHNSPLSEIACLGFEYGYSAEAPETLVAWEAQFGDFANSAQVIIDQFIISGLAKWGQTSRLTLLLPHGYEGSGPEHSSARIERFLSLAAEGNIRVANLTTPAQYFHLLRRQARITKQRPLVIFTPKSLLRLPQATNRIEHLAESRFFPVLGEPRVPIEKVTRLVLCTGKIYYDLVSHPNRVDNEGVAIGRIELLYPFPEGQVLELINTYPNLKEVVWVQEEPRNMGARAHMSPRLLQVLPDHLAFGYIGRPERASPGRATRPPTPPSRTASCGPRSTCRCRSRCTRSRRRASAERPPRGRGSAARTRQGRLRAWPDAVSLTPSGAPGSGRATGWPSTRGRRAPRRSRRASSRSTPPTRRRWSSGRGRGWPTGPPSRPRSSAPSTRSAPSCG